MWTLLSQAVGDLLIVGCHVVSWTPQFEAVSNIRHWLNQDRGLREAENPSGILVPSGDTLQSSPWPVKPDTAWLL